MWLAVTFEPFHCLAVDIQNLPSSSAGTLEEAILSFSEPETLDEYGTENKAAEKQVSVDPSVLFCLLPIARVVAATTFSSCDRETTRPHEPAKHPLSAINCTATVRACWCRLLWRICRGS